MHRSVINGDLEAVQECVRRDPGCIYVTDGMGAYPIHHACERGYQDVVIYLIQQAPSLLSCLDANHRTPLSIAIRHRHRHLFLALALETGISRWHQDKIWYNPSHISYEESDDVELWQEAFLDLFSLLPIENYNFPLIEIADKLTYARRERRPHYVRMLQMMYALGVDFSTLPPSMTMKVRHVPTQEQISWIRYRVYFSRSLVVRLLAFKLPLGTRVARRQLQ